MTVMNKVAIKNFVDGFLTGDFHLVVVPCQCVNNSDFTGLASQFANHKPLIFPPRERKIRLPFLIRADWWHMQEPSLWAQEVSLASFDGGLGL